MKSDLLQDISKSNEPLLNEDDFKTIAYKMAEGNGQVEYLRKLRKLVVGKDLTEFACNHNLKLFAALFFSTLITTEIWENLATDASFDYDEEAERLRQITKSFGCFLQDIFAHDMDSSSPVFKFAEILKNLYSYFKEISDNPELVYKGDKK